MPTRLDPFAEYRRRLADREARLGRLSARDDRLSNARLIVFLAGLALGVAILLGAAISSSWLWIPVAAFAALVVAHALTRRAREGAERAVAHYRRHLDRLENRWAGEGVTGERYADPHHPYAADLDLFGPGSLFELLCTARTGPGEATLAAWLMAPAPADEVRARQAAVEELRERLDLREDIDRLGSEVRAEVDPEHLSAWGEAASEAPPSAARWALLALTVAVVGLGLAAAFGLFSWWPFLAAFALQLSTAAGLQRFVGSVAGRVDRASHELEVLSGILARMEAEPFSTPRLARLKAALATDGVPASRRVADLRRRVDLLQARENQFFLPIALLLNWTVHLAFVIEAWRVAHGRDLRAWLDAVGELEALLALAAHAFHHPDDAVPELVDGAELEGEALGHPLLPKDAVVRNDVRLGGEARLLLVSGSNMSGKSTLLRTVGVNTVLALCGATVRGRRLVVGPLRVGATIRIQDSLREGASRFYAEITRLKQVVDLSLGEGVLLFLLDELLSGTNSHDRRLGAQSILAGLLDRGALGLVTTHDLALTAMGDQLPDAVNVHFEDRMEAGELVFDYRMRPGVVRHSNAIELMRSVGLEVVPSRAAADRETSSEPPEGAAPRERPAPDAHTAEREEEDA